MVSTDRVILLALYWSTKGHQWESKEGWTTDDDLLSWEGVNPNSQGREWQLSLASNKLKGPIPLELGNLAVLKCLNLGSNQLSGHIPPQLGNLLCLEVLELHSNNLNGRIPPELGKLGALRKLFLNDNKLSGPIPEALGALGKLENFGLSGDQLSGAIPPGLGNLAALETIDLSFNQLSDSIPKELGALNKLRELHLNNNRLTDSIPKELGALNKLRGLYLNNNRLTGISKGTAQALQDLQKNTGGRLQLKLFPGNQWRYPQEDIVQGGFGSVVEYWQAIERSGATRSWKLKVVLVGAVRAGKTRLARGMVHGEPRLCDEDDRTKGVDVHLDEPCKPDDLGKLELVFWDFAGHSEYYSTHQLFLSEGALHLLVVDLKRFSENPSERGDLVGIWLDALQCRVPGAKVLVIANVFDGWEGDHETMLGELRSAVMGHLIAKDAELETARQHSSTTSETPPTLVVLGVEAVSAADAESLVDLRGKLVDLASRKGLFPSVGQVLPVSWERVRAVLEAKRAGNDPDSGASRIGADSEGFPAVPGRSGVAVRFLRWKDAVREWERVVRALKLEREIGMTPWDQFVRTINFCEAGGRTDKAEAVFKSAVGLLVKEGTVLMSGEVLYVEPTWINELFRAILDHQLTDEAMENSWERELQKFAWSSAEYLKLKKVHDNFCSTGTLTIGYLRFLWRNTLGIGDEDIFRCMLSTMSQHGVIFKGTPARTGDEDVESELGDDSKLFVPVRLPSSILLRNLSECETLRRYQYRKELIYNILQNTVPPGVLGLALARFLCCEGVKFHACWSRGAAFAMGGPEVLIYLTNAREGVSDKANITVQVFGQELSGELHNAVERVQETIEAMFAKYFRGLFVELKKGHPRTVRGADAGLERVDSLQAHMSRLAAQVGDLKHELNIGLAGLGALLGSMSENFEGLGQVESVLNDVRIQLQDQGARQYIPSEAGVRLSSLERLVEGNDGVMGRLDFLVAMLMTERAGNITAPRFACVLPPWKFALPHGLSAEEMDPREWTNRFAAWREDGFKDGKRLFETEMRIFPVCAFSQELVPCGDNGQGYSVTRAREWARNIASVAQALTTVALPAVELAPVAALAGGAAQKAVDYAANKTRPGDRAQYAGTLRNGQLGEDGVVQVQELKGHEYESLRKFIHELEIGKRMEINHKTRKAKKDRLPPPKTSEFVFFEEKMVKVQARGGDGEAQWVLERHEDAWYASKR